MLNQDMEIQCAISTAAMDDLEGKCDVKPHQRVDQFKRLREVIEEQASRKFFEEQVRVCLLYAGATNVSATRCAKLTPRCGTRSAHLSSMER